MLQYREAPNPEPKAGELRIAVRAAGVDSTSHNGMHALRHHYASVLLASRSARDSS